MIYPAEFEAFWSAYPRRIGTNPKKLAYNAWTKMLKQASADDLTRAAKAFAAECAKLKTDPAFVPHARTWLNQERWTDYLGSSPDTPPEGDGEDLPHLFHILRDRRPDLTVAIWKSWLAPLKISKKSGEPIIITAPTAFESSQCQTRWGSDLTALLGPIVWRVAK